MKKTLIAVILFAVCSFLLVSCGNSSKVVIPTDNITKVNISTQPYSDSYARDYIDSEKIAAVIDYLSGLSLKDEFSENPDEYAGMAYIITISYEDGTSEVYNHFGNMFFGHIKDDAIHWYRMQYDEAEEFSNILQKNASDE